MMCVKEDKQKESFFQRFDDEESDKRRWVMLKEVCWMGVDGCVSCRLCLFVAVCVLILKTESG